MAKENYVVPLDNLLRRYNKDRQWLSILCDVPFDEMNKALSSKKLTYGKLQALLLRGNITLSITIQGEQPATNTGKRMDFLRNNIRLHRIGADQLTTATGNSKAPDVWWENDDITLCELLYLEKYYNSLTFLFNFTGIGNGPDLTKTIPSKEGYWKVVSQETVTRFKKNAVTIFERITPEERKKLLTRAVLANYDPVRDRPSVSPIQESSETETPIEKEPDEKKPIITGRNLKPVSVETVTSSAKITISEPEQEPLPEPVTVAGKEPAISDTAAEDGTYQEKEPEESTSFGKPEETEGQNDPALPYLKRKTVEEEKKPSYSYNRKNDPKRQSYSEIKLYVPFRSTDEIDRLNELAKSSGVNRGKMLYEVIAENLLGSKKKAEKPKSTSFTKWFDDQPKNLTRKYIELLKENDSVIKLARFFDDAVRTGEVQVLASRECDALKRKLILDNRQTIECYILHDEVTGSLSASGRQKTMSVPEPIPSPDNPKAYIDTVECVTDNNGNNSLVFRGYEQKTFGRKPYTYEGSLLRFTPEDWFVLSCLAKKHYDEYGQRRTREAVSSYNEKMRSSVDIINDNLNNFKKAFRLIVAELSDLGRAEDFIDEWEGKIYSKPELGEGRASILVTSNEGDHRFTEDELPLMTVLHLADAMRKHIEA